MANSQNGWPVIGREFVDQEPIFGTVRVPNGVREGDVAVVLRWVARRFHATVRPLVPGWCWGWHQKKIEGSDTWSNHASGTAVDFNAPDLPMGKPTRDSMSDDEIDACHAIERASGGVVRWGGDFSRPDPMHWEIVGTPSQVAAFAREIKGEEMQPGDILNNETTHGDGKIYTVRIALHNTAEVLRRGGWRDWWIVQKIEGLADHARGQSTALNELKQQVAELTMLVQALGVEPGTGSTAAKSSSTSSGKTKP